MRFLRSLVVVLFPLSVTAQPNISYSNNTFPEPNGGWNRIIMLKDGRTVYMNGTSATLNIRVYDKDRKQLAMQNVPFRNSVQGGIQGKDPVFEDAFEVNGKVVTMMTSRTGCGMGGEINCVKALYRLVIDPSTAKITAGDKLCEAAKVRSWGDNLGVTTVNDIYVAKDPASDMYAVLVFNGYTEDMPDRIKLMTYNGNNELVKTAVLDAPSTKDRAVHFAGMCMYNKNLYLGTNMRNAKIKTLDVPLCVSVLKDGADQFETTVLKLNPFAINSDCKMAFNAAGNMLELLITTQTDKKNTSGFFANNSETTTYYTTGIVMIDPAAMEIKFAGGIDGSLADAYAKQKLGEKDGFNGVMPVFYMNTDNTITVLPEEQYTVTRSSGRGSSITATMVDKVGVIKLDASGKAVESYVVRIREVAANMYRNSAPWYYFDYKYFNTPKAGYIVMNDLEENVDKPETAKPHSLMTISDASTVLYKMTNGKVEKSFLWGTPEKKKDNKFAMIGTGAYDESSQTFATVVVNGKDKQARVAWVKLD